VDEVVFAGPPGRALVLPLVDGFDPAGRPVLQHFSQETDPLRALAAERAALRPPYEVVGVAVRLAVPDAGARDCPLPEPADPLLGRQVAPALLEVPLVLHFVEHDGLAVPSAVRDRTP